MRARVFAFAAAAASAAFATGAIAAESAPLTVGEKTALQAAMHQHIDTAQINGAYLRLNSSKGAVESLAVSKAHPMILRMGEHFVLCSDFRSVEGKEVPVDFYIARDGDRYVVFHTEIANRKPLERMMSEGKIKPAE